MRIHCMTGMLAALVVLALLGACNDHEPQIDRVDTPAPPDAADAYNAEADPASEAATPDTAADDGDAAADDANPYADAEMEAWEGDGIAWQTPQPWTTAEGSGFRFATIYHEEDEQTAEIAVTQFGGDVGGVRANIERWAGQVGAPIPSDEQEMAELITEMQIDGVNALLVDIEGADELRLIAIVLPDQAHDRTWFFRVSGQRDAVAKALPALERIADTIRLEGGAEEDDDA